MTSAFYPSKNKTLFLCSPVTLLVLLAVLFTFFLTAPDRFSYIKNPDAEVIYKNGLTVDEGYPDYHLRTYFKTQEEIKTNSDQRGFIKR